MQFKFQIWIKCSNVALLVTISFLTHSHEAGRPPTLETDFSALQFFSQVLKFHLVAHVSDF